MTDEEILQRYLEYARSQGWRSDETAHAIGISRATLFNWKARGNISNKGRKAMSLFVNKKSEEKETPRSSDSLLEYIVSEWHDLPIEAKLEFVSIIERIKSMREGGKLAEVVVPVPARVACPRCQASIQAPNEAGAKFECPECGQRMKLE